MTFRLVFNLEDSAVYLNGTYDPPRGNSEAEYGNWLVNHGHVVMQEPFRVAIADGIEGATIDAVVNKTLGLVRRATW